MHNPKQGVLTLYTENTLKTLVNFLIGKERPIIAELCVVYGYYSFFLPMQNPYSYTFCRQPIYSLYHDYNYSYLILTNFIGSSYMSCIWL